MAEYNAPLTPERLARRRELCESLVTLDGKMAKITGVRLPFAHVVNPKTGQSVEFAWETVEHVVAEGGNFKS